MQRARIALSWILQNFGPLLVFLAVKNTLGLKPALAASLAWSVAEIGYVVGWKRQRPTMFFAFSAAVTLIFGVFDVYADNPFLFRYEAALSNVVTGVYFGATIFIGKPLIQEFAERAGTDDVDSPGARKYLRLLTVAWTAYFFVKAALYVVLAHSTISFELATFIRSVVGPLSIAAMLGGERLLRKQTIRLLRVLRLLPPAAAEPGASA